MSGHDLFREEDLLAIPDPAAKPVRPLPPPVLPSEPSPTRRQARARRLVALALGASWLALIPIVFGPRPDLGSAVVLTQVALAFVLGVAALWLAVSPSRPLGPSLRQAGVLALLALAVFSGASLLAPCEQHGATLLYGAFVCGDVVLGFSLVPAALAAWALRRSAATGAGRHGALLGLGIGFCATCALTMHCPQLDGLHMLLGHGLPVLGVAGLSFLTLRRFLRA